MKNYRTTVGGFLAALGVILSANPGNLGLIGNIIEAVGLAIVGYSAKDHIGA